jgi:hypothetical protein
LQLRNRGCRRGGIRKKKLKELGLAETKFGNDLLKTNFEDLNFFDFNKKKPK